MSRYAEEFHRSLADPEGFWGEAAKDIDWYRAPTQVLDRSNPPFYRWFAGGVLNTCFNAVDRHVRDGRGDQAAVIYDSPVTGAQRTMTYQELLDEVSRFGGVAAHELAVRIDDAAPVVVVSASCGIEVSRVIEYKPILDRALELSAHK